MPYLSQICVKLSITKQELQSSANWVITKMLNNIEILDKQKNILSFITTSVRNFCIDEYRKVVVRSRREGDFKSSAPTSVCGVSHTLEFIIEDISDSDKEAKILSKIILESKKPKDVAIEMKVSNREMNALLTKVKDRLL